MIKPRNGLFIVGTDTNVGKTFIAAMIVRALRRAGKQVGVYKPVATGCVVEDGLLVSDDAAILWKAAGQPLTLDAVCPQRFTAPLAPHLAAQDEDKQVDAQRLRDGLAIWNKACDVVIVEGVGGLMSPVSDDEFIADLAAEFGYPLIVVSENKLGAINQTLQTLITASSYAHGLETAGIVLNEPRALDISDGSCLSNADEIRRRAIPPLLAHVRYQQSELDSSIDWFQLASGSHQASR
jgi:dethiobiotin synthetase